MITVCKGRFKEREKKRQGMTRQDNNTRTHTRKIEVRTFGFVKEIAIQVHE
jgi:hypothetical protein